MPPAVSDSTSAALTTLVIGGGGVGFNWLPVIVADRQGFFKRHFMQNSARGMGSGQFQVPCRGKGSQHLKKIPS